MTVKDDQAIIILCFLDVSPAQNACNKKKKKCTNISQNMFVLFIVVKPHN